MDIEAGIEEHKRLVMNAFVELLKAETDLNKEKEQYSKAKAAMDLAIGQMITSHEKKWEALIALLDETGETEVVLPGATNDYKVAITEPADYIEVPDINAVPEEWTKTETMLKKAEINKYVKGLQEKEEPLPNWVNIVKKPGSWKWKLIKKKPLAA